MQKLSLFDQAEDEYTLYILPLVTGDFAVIFKDSITVVDHKEDAVRLAKQATENTDFEALMVYDDGTIGQAFDPDEGLALNPAFVEFLEQREQNKPAAQAYDDVIGDIEANRRERL
jgi:hypothetical protein